PLGDGDLLPFSRDVGLEGQRQMVHGRVERVDEIDGDHTVRGFGVYCGMFAFAHVSRDVAEGGDPEPGFVVYDIFKVFFQFRDGGPFPAEAVDAVEDEHQPGVFVGRGGVDPGLHEREGGGMEGAALPLNVVFVCGVWECFAGPVDLLEKRFGHAVAQGRVYLIGNLHYTVVFVAVRHFGGEGVFSTEVVFDLFLAFLEFVADVRFVETGHGGMGDGMTGYFVAFGSILAEIVPAGADGFFVFGAGFVAFGEFAVAYFGVEGIHKKVGVLPFA